jgi:hypothetical protein
MEYEGIRNFDFMPKVFRRSGPALQKREQSFARRIPFPAMEGDAVSRDLNEGRPVFSGRLRDGRGTYSYSLTGSRQ